MWSSANILNLPWVYLNSTNIIKNEHLNRQQANELPVADSNFVLKSSNKLAAGILIGYEHCGAVQTFWLNLEYTWTVQTLFRMSIWIGNRQLSCQLPILILFSNRQINWLLAFQMAMSIVEQCKHFESTTSILELYERDLEEAFVSATGNWVAGCRFGFWFWNRQLNRHLQSESATVAKICLPASLKQS